MPIEVTARHMHATGDVQQYARRKAEALVEEFPRIEHVHVILDVENRLRVARVFVQAKNHIRSETREGSENLQAAIDAAFDKVETQLRRLRDKVQDHKPIMKKAESHRRTVGSE